MEEIKKHIQSAYEMLGKIRVNGDAVDLMAASRAALREAYRLAGEEAKDGRNNPGEG